VAALEFPTIDFDDFHRVDLPKRIEAGNGALAAPDLTGVGTLGFRTPDGAAYTYVPGPDTVEIWSTDAAADTLVELSREAFSDFANELRSCFGLLYAGMAEVTRGDFGWFERWEPALRALYDGRPILDLAGAERPADLERSFTFDDDSDAMREFLDRNGFLHVRGVFDPDEVRALGDEVERVRADATADDGASWWATQGDGSEVCCRLIYLARSSDRIGGLGADERLHRLAALGGEGLEPEIDCLDGLSVVIKNPDVTAGLSDLPWHRDCGLGGHPVLCPSVAIGIQLDRASAETGQLHFVAGSHRGSSHPLRPGDEATQPAIAIDAEPGDVTVHFGDVLHAAPPPTGTGPFRRAMYVTFTRPETIAYVGPGNGYNDVLFEHDGRVRSPDEIRAGA
jgi:Phytanoyl-CoA dioxygenase (PhyH)